MSFKTMQIYFFLVIELVLRNVIPYQLPERIYFLFFMFDLWVDGVDCTLVKLDLTLTVGHIESLTLKLL